MPVTVLRTCMYLTYVIPTETLHDRYSYLLDTKDGEREWSQADYCQCSFLTTIQTIAKETWDGCGTIT